MPTLTVTEKSFWKDRIAARIDRALERIRAQHLGLFERVRREAHAQALASLGLADAYAELEAILAEEARLARRKKQAQRMLLATVRGVPPEEVPDTIQLHYGSGLPLPVEAADTLARRQALHQERLLADDPIGRGIVRLEAERDRLLDVIWLATSPSQVRTLWSRVGALLGDEPTQLEREALTIPAAEGNGEDA
jgi:hypothetical protein